VATFLTLPKQIILVYLGVLLVAQQDDTVVKAVILVVGLVVTVALGVYIWYKMAAVKKVLLAEQAARKAARQSRESVQSDQLKGSGESFARVSLEEVSLVKNAQAPGTSRNGHPQWL